VAVLVYPQYTLVLVLAVGVVSVASIVDYTATLWRARTR